MESNACLPTSYNYDMDGRLAAVTLPGWSSISYGYNASNLRTSVTDANGNTTSFTYDANGNTLTKTNAQRTGDELLLDQPEFFPHAIKGSKGFVEVGVGVGSGGHGAQTCLAAPDGGKDDGKC